jgi:hypothetical protein
LRNLIFIAGLLAAAAPAAAQPGRAPGAHLPPPGAVDAMGDRIEDLADALMDVDVGPVADAVEPDRYHGDRTLGDYASRRDPYARDRMHRSIERTTARVNATARELAIVTPMLLRSLQDARRRLEGALYAPDGAQPYRDQPYRGQTRSAPRPDAPPPANYPFVDE